MNIPTPTLALALALAHSYSYSYSYLVITRTRMSTWFARRLLAKKKRNFERAIRSGSWLNGDPVSTYLTTTPEAGHRCKPFGGQVNARA